MTLNYVNLSAPSVMPYSTNSHQSLPRTMIKNFTVHLGPREVVIGGRVIAIVGDITVHVDEATEEELAALKKEPVILLVKPLPKNIEFEGG